MDVVEIDCQNVDDLFVHVTCALDLPAISHAVEQTGFPLIEIRSRAACV
jgi:hypothetical protein